MSRRTRRGRAFYAELVARRERGDWTWPETALRGGVPISTLLWWAKRLREEEGPEGSFVELAAPHEAMAAERMEIVLGGGRRLLLPRGIEAEDVAKLVRALDLSC